MVITGPPRKRNQPGSLFTFSLSTSNKLPLLFKTHFVCVKMSDFTIALV
jgi:hypothetical protein